MKQLLYISISLMVGLACHSDHSSDHKTTDINLNNGAKWKVNEEMKPHIEEAKRILNTYLSQNQSDHQSLAESLKMHNNALIKSCTMTGESHDELHKWLHPHMKLIEQLENTDDSEEAEKIIEQIQESFDTYKNYFE